MRPLTCPACAAAGAKPALLPASAAPTATAHRLNA
jgi:hypothetical protein